VRSEAVEKGDEGKQGRCFWLWPPSTEVETTAEGQDENMLGKQVGGCKSKEALDGPLANFAKISGLSVRMNEGRSSS